MKKTVLSILVVFFSFSLIAGDHNEQRGFERPVPQPSRWDRFMTHGIEMLVFGGVGLVAVTAAMHQYWVLAWQKAEPIRALASSDPIQRSSAWHCLQEVSERMCGNGSGDFFNPPERPKKK